jgi:hypothetical protein
MNATSNIKFRTPSPRDVPSDRVQVYQATFGERIDQIAAKVYGDETYWRVIAEFNELTDATKIEAGQLLRIPHRDYIEDLEL